MGALIDTSVLIAIERATTRPETQPWPDGLGELFTCAITIGELAFGVALSTIETKRAARQRFLEAVLSAFPCLEITEREALVYARIAADLRRRGTPIGVNDTWIAAIAVVHDLAVLTANVQHFESVPDLRIARWPRT